MARYSKTLAALRVISETPHIREYLQGSDPKALAQVEERIAALEAINARQEALNAEYLARVPAAFRLPKGEA